MNKNSFRNPSSCTLRIGFVTYRESHIDIVSKLGLFLPRVLWGIMGKLLHHPVPWLPYLNMGMLLVGLPQNIYHFQTLFEVLGIQ